MTVATGAREAPVVPRARQFGGIPVSLAVLAVLFVWHISVGARSLAPATILEALYAYDDTLFEHMIVRDLRMPRAIMAAVVGACLSVAGALMQGVTRNPLAEPGILGLMAGASFAVVIGIGFFEVAGAAWIPLYAAVGALVTALVVWSIAWWAPGGPTPLTLTLAGAVVTAFLAALISMANLVNEQGYEQLRVWLAGSLSGRDFDVLLVSLPWLVIGGVLALFLARQVTVLAMGDDVAQGLGVRAGRLKLQALVCVVILTACAVAMAGPLGFVGLVIPHMVRLFVGSDYRWIVPYSAVVGAAYLLGVDIIARLVLRPQEVATGIVTALFGAPLFIHLVRQRAR